MGLLANISRRLFTGRCTPCCRLERGMQLVRFCSVISTADKDTSNTAQYKQRDGMGSDLSASQIYHLLKDSDEVLHVNRILTAIYQSGLQEDDPRISTAMKKFRKVQNNEVLNGRMNLKTFEECISGNEFSFLQKALCGRLVVPDFQTFSDLVSQIFENCKDNTGGKVADYIPQLAKFDPDLWGVSVCTVSGQRFSIGDAKVPFCVQSVGKVMSYATVLDEYGQHEVHRYVGHEPSGKAFNEISLDHQGRPHNPMINPGAIVCCSLFKPELTLPDRYEYLEKKFDQACGYDFVGFSNSTFLSERETADINFSLAYYMRKHKVFPPNTNLMETLDFYFHLCSLEMNCSSGAVMAATLANGGICPITGEQVFSSSAVRNTLVLMHSCGMYDFSGTFAFQVGLPAKSGVSGAILIVVPNVCGIVVWSPPLDHYGNSVRGVQFCRELVSLFNFHLFDNTSLFTINPSHSGAMDQAIDVTSLLYFASAGNLAGVKRLALEGVDMNQADYDERTPLHLAACEGHLHIVKFLVQNCRVFTEPKDRWGSTPYDNAVRFGHPECAAWIQSNTRASIV